MSVTHKPSSVALSGDSTWRPLERPTTQAIQTILSDGEKQKRRSFTTFAGAPRRIPRTALRLFKARPTAFETGIPIGLECVIQWRDVTTQRSSRRTPSHAQPAFAR